MVNYFDNKFIVISFDKNFIVMKNVVGAPARGENFFQRDGEVEKLTDRLDAGNNIQIAAPRRVGKTSILHYLRDNSINGNVYVYVDTESISDSGEFFKKLLKEILRADAISESTRIKKLLEAGAKFFQKIKSIKVLGQGLDFTEDATEINYAEEITNFLAGMQLEDDKKLVLLIDEFPQTIINIADVNKGNTEPAIHFLQANRELRLHPDILPKVRFIYTGSIGLNHTVAAINASAFVNDLSTVEVAPLTTQEGHELVKHLLQDKSISMEEGTVQYLLDKIAWLIPFHIQLAIQEITSLSGKGSEVAFDTIDGAFDNMVAARNHSHFEHYYSRLKSQFKSNAFSYATAILETAAVDGSIDSGKLYDTAVKYEVQDQYKQIIGALTYDGYINNNTANHAYQFNSPVVRLWWQKFICK